MGYKLWDFACICGVTFEALVEPDEAAFCPVCGASCRERLPYVCGTAHRAQVNPAKTREMFAKSVEMRNKITGKTPWRRNSYSQTGND